MIGLVTVSLIKYVVVGQMIYVTNRKMLKSSGRRILK
jgi:hypothetical protein